VTAADASGLMLIAPHRYPDMSAEREIAEQAGLELAEAKDRDEFRALAPRAEIVMLTPYAVIDPDTVAAMGRCRAIVRYGAGVDNVDLGAATEAGIPVANVPDAAVEEVALHAVAMITSLARRIPDAGLAIRRGDWKTNVTAGVRRFSKQVVGLIGLGRIGSRTADHLQALGAKVIAYDPVAETGPVPLVDLDDLFERADVISLHAPLTETTRNIVSRERMEAMKPGSIVVNVSRGGLVDEAALAELLESGHLGGAGIDVFEEEPMALDHPLLEAPRAILTPHVAWRNDDSARDYQVKAQEQAEMALAGREMTSTVNPDAYERRRVLRGE